MNSSGLTIDVVRVSELEGFARDIGCPKSKHEVIPITRHRARAHAANPYADPDDIGLMVANQNDRCVGYLGMVPGLLRVGNRFERVHWLSTLFVSPTHRGTGIGRMMVTHALSLEYDFVASALSRAGEGLFHSLAFVEVGPLEYLSLKRTPARQAAPQSSRLARCATTVLRRLARRLTPNRRPRYSDSIDVKLEIGPWHFRPIPAVTPQLLADNGLADAAFHRGAEIVNWMAAFPWIAESRNTSPSGYYFSDVRDVFRYILLGAYRNDDNVCRGFVTLLLSAKDKTATLKVLDNALPPDDREACLPQVALACADRFAVKRVEMSRECRLAAEVFGSNWSSEPKQRLYFCRPYGADSPLAEALDRLQLDYCDGENPFI